jgi:Glycosyl transferase family 2
VSGPPPDPCLAVVIVVGPLRERASDALASVLSQGISDHLEVILVDCEPPTAPPVAGSEHPAVRVLHLPAGAHFGTGRALATAAARAPAVAFLEEHARALPGWAEALVRAHRGPWSGVGYEVHNGNPGSGRSDIQGLMSYGLFAPPLTGGESHFLSGHNCAYKRAVLLSFGDRLGDLLLIDNVLQKVLLSTGHRFFLEPGAKIAHRNEVSVRSAARGYAAFHRAFGSARSREGGWPLLRRAAYVILAPAIPLYFIARLTRTLVRRRSPQLRLLLRNLPYVYLIQLVAALAQATGILFGPGASAGRFSRFEVAEPRPLRGQRE